MSNIIYNDYNNAIILNVSDQLNGCFNDEIVHEIIRATSGLEEHSTRQDSGNEEDQSVNQQLHNENTPIQNEIANKLKNLCRCCMIENREMKSIFDEDNYIATMIIMLADLELTPHDGLPGNICVDCINKLTKCISFKQQIEANDWKLKYYITEGFQQGIIFEKIDVEQLEKIEEINENDFDNLKSENSSNHTIHSINNEDENELLQQSATFYTQQQNHENVNEINIENLPQEQTVQELLQIEPKFDENSYDNFQNDEIIKKRKFHSVSEELQRNFNECIPNNVNNYDEENNDDDDDVDNKKIVIESNEKLNHDHIIENNKSIETHNQYIHCPEIKKKHEKRNSKKIQGNSKFKKINSQQEIQKNVQNTENDGNLTCEKCNKSFNNRKIYSHHIQSHSKLHFCEYCKQSFRYRTLFKKHLKCHKNSDEIKTTTIKNLNNENLEMIIKKCFKCKICDVQFSLEDDLYIHGSLHDHKNKFICRKCGKEFLTFIKLKRHLPTHFEDKPYKCEVCDLGFPEVASLTRHSRKHYGLQKDRKFECEFCNKKYYDSYSLVIHKRKHTGEKPWICEICDKTFVDSRLLNSHLKIHTNEKLHECDICNKRFTHSSTLVSHIRTHTGEKPYVCGVCNKTFIQSSNLNLHMRVHTGERPYKCLLCDMSFSSSSILSSHKQTHTKEKPYICPVCNKNFSRRHLNIHMRIHFGEKPYECNECLKNFRTTGQLSQHKKMHLRKRQKQQTQNESEHDEKQSSDNTNKKKQINNEEAFSTKGIKKKIQKTKKRKQMENEKKDEENIYNEHLEHDKNGNNDDDNDSVHNENELLVNDLLAAVTSTVNTPYYNNDNGSAENVSIINGKRHTITISELSELNDDNENIDCDKFQTVDPNILKNCQI